MLTIDRHHNIILQKLSVFIFLCGMSFFSENSTAMNTRFEKIDDDNYKIYGTITESDLYWHKGNSGSSNNIYIAAAIPSERKYQYSSIGQCNNIKSEATSKLNNFLSSGVTVTNNHSYYMLKDWAVTIECYSPSDGGYWSTTPSSDPVPPVKQTICSINTPQTIEFTNLRPGNNQMTYQTADIIITCDKNASGNIDIISTLNGELDIEDAKIKISFGNNELQYSFKETTTVSTFLLVAVQDAGKTTGEKKGSVVIRANWE